MSVVLGLEEVAELFHNGGTLGSLDRILVKCYHQRLLSHCSVHAHLALFQANAPLGRAGQEDVLGT